MKRDWQHPGTTRILCCGTSSLPIQSRDLLVTTMQYLETLLTRLGNDYLPPAATPRLRFGGLPTALAWTLATNLSKLSIRSSSAQTENRFSLPVRTTEFANGSSNLPRRIRSITSLSLALHMSLVFNRLNSAPMVLSCSHLPRTDPSKFGTRKR